MSATSLTGYGASGPPSGKYFAPANGPDCVEVAADDLAATNDGFGECGTRSLIVTGPMFKNVDLSLTKVVPVAGRTRLEFRVEALNVFNRPNFVPVGGIVNNVSGLGASANAYEVTALTGANTSRTVQLVSRFSW